MVRGSMMEKLDLQDLLFFFNRIESMKIESIYMGDFNKIIKHAVDNFSEIEKSLEKQHELYLSLWRQMTRFCNLIFIKRDDDFFNMLRSIEYEFAGRTLMIEIEMGLLVRLPK